MLTSACMRAADADEVRLRELCSELLGPVRPAGEQNPNSTAEEWQPEVGSWCLVTLTLHVDAFAAQREL